MMASERPAHPAAEALQRPDRAASDQLFDFGRLELAAREHLPEREVAFLALEFLVILLAPRRRISGTGVVERREFAGTVSLS